MADEYENPRKGLEAKPVSNPRQRGDEPEQGERTQNNADADTSVLPKSLHDLLPPALRRLLFTGSCCAGVAALFLISAWDHGILPGVDSSLAKASETQNIKIDLGYLKNDMGDLYVLFIGRMIRDLSTENCVTHSASITDQIDLLQAKYRSRTGATYPHTECKKVS